VIAFVHDLECCALRQRVRLGEEVDLDYLGALRMSGDMAQAESGRDQENSRERQHHENHAR
jgi:hypothetical protein